MSTVKCEKLSQRCFKEFTIAAIFIVYRRMNGLEFFSIALKS